MIKSKVFIIIFFFYKIHNVSAMKMHQMATKIGSIVRVVFTDTIIFEGKINKPICNKDIIGGIRESAIKEFIKCINTTPRESKYIEECPKPTKLTQIKEFKLDNEIGCLLQEKLEQAKHTCAKDYKKKY